MREDGVQAVGAEVFRLFEQRGLRLVPGIRPLAVLTEAGSPDNYRRASCLTNVAADRHFRLRLRRNGDSVLAAELKALAGATQPCASIASLPRGFLHAHSGCHRRRFLGRD